MVDESQEPEALSPFHNVGKILPESVTVESVPPNETVASALELMRDKRFSQLPIVDGDGRLVGLFSLWSLVHLVINSGPNPIDVRQAEVRDAMAPRSDVTVDTSIYELMDRLDKHEAVLVTSPRGLQAVATTWDLLKYFFGVAHPYVLLGEIELALRSIIRRCVSDSDFPEVAKRALQGLYSPRPIPELPAMTFEDYRSIIGNKENWPLFEPILGKNRSLVIGKLEDVRTIRNDAFHFRMGPSIGQYDALRTHRDWLFSKEQNGSE